VEETEEMELMFLQLFQEHLTQEYMQVVAVEEFFHLHLHMVLEGQQALEAEVKVDSDQHQEQTEQLTLEVEVELVALQVDQEL
jgi:transcriptional antiterminator Rof (Rho-off)